MVNVHRAKTELSRLLEAVEAGEDVVIARAGVPVARLVPIRADQRVPGRLAKILCLRADFEAPLPPEIAEGFGGETEVKLLLDSHAYLWWLADGPELSPSARAAVADPANMVLVSAATIWEIEIKRALGRLEAGSADLVAEIEANRFGQLPGARDPRCGCRAAAPASRRPLRSDAHRPEPGRGAGVRHPGSGLRGVRGPLSLVGIWRFTGIPHPRCSAHPSPEAGR